MYEERKVPQTYDEVIAHLNATLQDEFFRACVIGIFECRIGMGESVMLAYENALRAAAGMEARTEE